MLVYVENEKKKWAGDICKGTLNIEFEQDWSVGLCATIGDATDRKLKTTFFSGIFPGLTDCHIVEVRNYKPIKFPENR